MEEVEKVLNPGILMWRLHFPKDAQELNAYKKNMEAEDLDHIDGNWEHLLKYCNLGV